MSNNSLVIGTAPYAMDLINVIVIWHAQPETVLDFVDGVRMEEIVWKFHCQSMPVQELPYVCFQMAHTLLT